MLVIDVSQRVFPGQDIGPQAPDDTCVRGRHHQDGDEEESNRHERVVNLFGRMACGTGSSEGIPRSLRRPALLTIRLFEVPPLPFCRTDDHHPACCTEWVSRLQATYEEWKCIRIRVLKLDHLDKQSLYFPRLKNISTPFLVVSACTSRTACLSPLPAISPQVHSTFVRSGRGSIPSTT